MRPLHLLLAVLLVLIIGAGSWFGYRLWQRQQLAAAALAGVSPVADLGRWPNEFGDQLETLAGEIAHSPTPVEPLGELAMLYTANDLKTEAEQALRVLLRLDPANPRWTYLLADLRSKAGDFAEARTWYARTVALAPDCAPALLHAAGLLAAGGAPHEARPLFERRLQLLPNDAEATYGLAKLDLASGDAAAAASRLREFVGRQPRLTEARQLLAQALETIGDQPGAAEQRAIVRHTAPTQAAPDPWLQDVALRSFSSYRLQVVGDLLIEEGQFQEALRFHQKTAALSPDDPETHERVARAYVGLGQLDEARRALDRALELSPQPDQLYGELVDLLFQQTKPDEATATAERAAKQFPDRAQLRYILGVSLQRVGRTDDAVRALQETIRLNPTLMEAHLELGRSLLTAGRRREARSSVARAHTIRPEDKRALSLLGKLEFDDGDLSAAASHAETLFRLYSDDADARRFFALVRFQQGNVSARTGRNAEARKFYESGLEADSTLGLLHGGLGMLDGGEGRLPDAIAQFRRFVAVAPEDAAGYVLLGSALQSSGQKTEADKIYGQGLAVARRSDDKAAVRELERRLAK